MSNKFPQEVRLLDISRQLMRRWKISAACLLCSVAVAIVAFWILPHIYRSEAQLYVRLGRNSSSLDAAATIGRTSLPSSLPSTREEEINTVTEILSSRTLAEHVVDALGPQAILHDQDPSQSGPRPETAVPVASSDVATAIVPVSMCAASLSVPTDSTLAFGERDDAVVKLQRMLQVQAIKKSDVVHIDCESRNPHLAQKIVACLVDCYPAEHLRLNRSVGAYEFFQQQADQMHATLNGTAEELRKLKERTGLASPEVQRDLMVTQAARLEDELFATATALASDEAEAKSLHLKVDTLPEMKVTSHTVGIENSGIELMRNELYRLQMNEQELAAKYTDDHILLKEVRERLAAAKKAFDAQPASHEQVSSGPNTVYEQSQLELAKLEPLLTSLRAKADTLQTQLYEVRQRINAYNGNELQIAELTRDLKRYETEYQAYAEHLEQTRIDQALEADRISNISVIQPATFEPKSIKTKSMFVVALVMLMGLSAAIGLPLFLESRKSMTKDAKLVANGSISSVAPLFRRNSEQISSNGS